MQNCGVVRVWGLSETSLSVRTLTEFARLLAGGPLESSDSPDFPPADQLAVSLRVLRARQPELFDASPERLRDWHRREAHAPATLAQAASALFHLERLAQLADDPTIREQEKRCRAALIPARDAAVPPQLLDLSRAYTHAFDLLPRRDFAQLPRGRQTLDGTEFDLRGLVQLDRRAERADAAGPFHPFAVISVGQRCRRLHFLQATEGDPRVDGSVVAHWIVHYADGSTREWPVIYGAHIRDGWWWMDQEPLEATQATLAWRGAPPMWNRPNLGGVRLFKTTWVNPQPEVEVTRLEFKIGETALKPFVVAITAE